MAATGHAWYTASFVTPAATDFAALERAIAGDVVVPDGAAYESARRPPIGRFHGVRPQAIVRCSAPADVVEAIAFARRYGADLAVRAGGHCFAGRSSTRGVLLDVSAMSAISVGGGLATIGAGARLGDVYDALEPHGLTIAAGCGPTVGISGLLLGGGLGILGRRHGLTSDQLVGARVVLADGRVVDCDEQRHADLFWALRGAGGCQFGVLTEVRLRTVPAPAATTLHVRWPYRDAAAVIEAWQAWAPEAPDELAASLLVTAGAEPVEPPVVHVFGAMAGTHADVTTQLDALVAAAGTDPSSAALRELPYRQAKRHLAEHGPGEEAAPGAHAYVKSEFFRRSVPAGAVAALVEHFTSGRTPRQLRVLDFTPWGGAYNRVAEDATAFAHRDERFLLKQDVVVDRDATTAERERARDWLERSWALAHPSGSGRVYPNFPDPELGDWRSAYHAGNLDRLTSVKAACDPDGIFRFDQSLP